MQIWQRLEGKKTYLLAFLGALATLYVFYRLDDVGSLIGLAISGAMAGMRKFNAINFIKECNQSLTGDTNMGISIQSILGIEGDIAAAMGLGQIVLVKFEGDQDMANFITAINKVLADLGKPPLTLKK